MTDDRAVRALEDVVAVETIAPGMVRVVTWSDAYVVDARDAGCNCPDKEYHDAPRCKHEHAAILATADRLPTPFEVTDDVSVRDVCWCDDEPTPCFECFSTERMSNAEA